ncbi:Translation initiation factor IF-3 [Candidatus Phytoplasma mali]|uniref:Translation initiation factor IF-3 n=1 Tax=Phytoplasma mali (strain AT) TaxID=482235 RepID=B3R0P4_PHYMT|nr:translation initiation factor IF-3 [Candidatus Phytoplasma mali]CAP18628.1 Translation initiation factor IF-3 [Candidatus Phytoplasma mali]
MIKNKKVSANVNLNILYNEDIPNGKYLIIDEKGNKIGVFDKKECLRIAEEKEIDILLVNSSSVPMIARLTDYSKYRYNQQKKNREMKKKQKNINVKEIRIGPNIGLNDFNIKVKNIQKFLSQDDKVKIIMRFRGRMIIHHKLGLEVLKKIITELRHISYTEMEPKLVGNQIIIILLPNKLKKISE